MSDPVDLVNDLNEAADVEARSAGSQATIASLLRGAAEISRLLEELAETNRTLEAAATVLGRKQVELTRMQLRLDAADEAMRGYKAMAELQASGEPPNPKDTA